MITYHHTDDAYYRLDSHEWHLTVALKIIAFQDFTIPQTHVHVSVNFQTPNDSFQVSLHEEPSFPLADTLNRGWYTWSTGSPTDVAFIIGNDRQQACAF